MVTEETINSLSREIRQAITEDSSVPRNVRSNVSGALEILEEQINDTNIPSHARTRLFEFIRDLEGVVRKWETNGGA